MLVRKEEEIPPSRMKVSGGSSTLEKWKLLASVSKSGKKSSPGIQKRTKISKTQLPKPGALKEGNVEIEPTPPKDRLQDMANEEGNWSEINIPTKES